MRFDIGKFWKNKKQPFKTKKKRSEKIKQLFLSGKWKPWNIRQPLAKQHKQKLQASNILKWKSPALRKLMSQIKRAYWTRAREEEQSLRIKKFWHENPEKLKSMRQKIIRKYNTSNWENDIGKAVREYYRLNPESRMMMRKKQKELYKNHPAMRRERQAVADLYYATHPDERRHFFGYKAKKTRYKTALGYVKSKIEKTVLDYLSKPEIYRLLLPEYEPFTLYLDRTKPIPDVYLRKLNIIIEIYGGHPGAWQRKVKKNRDYRKEKIPVISVTPSEIWNLDRYLLREAIRLGKTPLAKNFKPEKFMKPKPEWLEKLKAEIKKSRINKRKD